DRDEDMLRRGVALARALFSYMLDVAYDHKVIDFTDQVFLPVHPDFRDMCRLPRPDRVFVDEAQDLSPVQVELVAAMLGMRPGETWGTRRAWKRGRGGKPEAAQRVVFVGDRAQAIYGWRGAASDAMDLIKVRFACDELPLTVCWRCDADIVDLAAGVGVTEILSAPGKSRGEVINLCDVAGEAGSVRVAARPGSVAICRTTAPLIAAAYRIIRKGRRAVVLGREIGAGLVALVKKLCGKSIKPSASADVIFERLDRWLEREVMKAVDREDKAAAAQDRAECIRCVAEELPEDRYTVGDLIAQIESIFSDQQAAGGVTLCTIHKSKGLEWDEVTILDWHRLPSRWAKRAWQVQQERHCVYVAITRARHRLTLCRADDFEPSA
ncbi:MAG TPA: 3'-5' exonuclease, partial [Nannocystis sp.]